MTPAEVEGWIKLAGIVVGMIAPAYGVWVLMQKRITDLEEKDRQREQRERSSALEQESKEEKRRLRDEANRAEAERQQEAWWKVTDGLRKEMSDHVTTLRQLIFDLDKSCSNANTEIKANLGTLKERVDLHSMTTVNGLAGVVKNYSDMLTETMDMLRALLKEIQQQRRGA